MDSKSRKAEGCLVTTMENISNSESYMCRALGQCAELARVKPVVVKLKKLQVENETKVYIFKSKKARSFSLAANDGSIENARLFPQTGRGMEGGREMKEREGLH